MFCLLTSVNLPVDNKLVYFEVGFLFCLLCRFKNRIKFFMYFVDFPGKIVCNTNSRIFEVSSGGEGTPYNGLCGEAPPERDTFFRLQVYERVWIS